MGRQLISKIIALTAGISLLFIAYNHNQNNRLIFSNSFILYYIFLALESYKGNSWENKTPQIIKKHPITLFISKI